MAAAAATVDRGLRFEFEIFHEQLGPLTLEQHEAREREHRQQANVRPHCCKCGRFIRKATLRTQGGGYWSIDDWYTSGECPTHGRVEAVWERA